MITQETIYTFHDISPTTKTVSISLIIVFKNDGVEVGRNPPHTRAFVPGQIEDVKEYIGVTDSPEITYLNSIWTQAVIDAWNESQNQQLI